MAKKMLGAPNKFVENTTNLSAVTTATNGDKIDMQWYDQSTIYVSVSGNTGSVKVAIQGSHNGTTWVELSSKTYAASNSDDATAIEGFHPFMRTVTSAHSNATVTTTITGRG